MGKRMVIGLVVLSGVLAGSLAAHAAPAAKTTVTLSCSRGVSATAGVLLYPDIEGSGDPAQVGVGDESFACGGDGPNRDRVVVTGTDARSAVVTTFDVTTPEGVVRCGDPDSLRVVPLRMECPTDSRGAKLVVR